MKRKAVLIPVVLVVVLALAGIAYAAYLAKLNVKGTASSTTDVVWASSPAPTTNDTGVLNDPTGVGMSPARETYNLAATSASLSSGAIVLTTTQAYDGYVVTAQGNIGPNPTPLTVQGITLVDDPSVAGTTRFTPGAGTIQAYLRDSGPGCGQALDSTNVRPVEFAVRYADVASAAQYAFKVELTLVPTSAYNAAACAAQSWTAM